MLAKPNAFQWKHCANIYDYYLKYLSSTSTFKWGCSLAALQTYLFYIHLQLWWTGNWRLLSFEVCKKIQIATKVVVLALVLESKWLALLHPRLYFPTDENWGLYTLWWCNYSIGSSKIAFRYKSLKVASLADFFPVHNNGPHSSTCKYVAIS